jgi:beta-glucosidase
MDPGVDEVKVKRLLDRLTLEEVCRLVGGASNWRTHPIERLGIPALKMTDGPNGARGEHTTVDSTPAVVVPVGIVQGATWDPSLIERVGDLLGREARRRSAHVLLAPAVNLHRTPIGGRTFEYFSEDPELSAALAVATVRGVQANEVAVTVKHYVANDTEVDRHTVNVTVDERVLRELYLRPFEAAVVQAGAWGVMSAYNQVGGHYCAAHDRLLNGVLRDEWVFDGFVVSDWYGAHDPVASANGGLSIEMPGPSRVYGARLLAAVRSGEVDEATVRDLARDVLVLIERTRATERSADEPEHSVDDADERALCREVAIAGTVLARNEGGALPLDPSLSVAVIGPNAARTQIMGGGSSSLRPLPHRSIQAALADRVASVTHEVGCLLDIHTPLPAADRLIGPDGAAGLEVSFLPGTEPVGAPSWTGRATTSIIAFAGSLPRGVEPGPCVLRIRGAYVPVLDGPHQVGAIVTGRPRVEVAGRVLIEPDAELPSGDSFYGFGSAEQLTTVEATAGEPISLEVSLAMGGPFGAVRLGVREPDDPAQMMDRAVAAARSAQAAVVVVGTTDEWETEGHDRDTIALPGDQDELVRRVAAVNDRTVVVVNAGSPVAMPWFQDVAAVVVPFFGGIEAGDAVADVLLGTADPGGRLPTTFPVRLEDAPAWPHYAPVDGVQTYGEGFGIGYRGHDRFGVVPLLPFGHGLSYGAAEWGEPVASAEEIEAGGTVTVTVPVTVTGDRDATVVVQGYVAPLNPPVEREPKALRAWAKAVVSPGATRHLELRFGPEAFRRWDDGAGRWTIDPGRYDLLLAASATDIRAAIPLTLI